MTGTLSAARTWCDQKKTRRACKEKNLLSLTPLCVPHLEYEVPVLLGLQEGVPIGDGVADNEALPSPHVLFPHGRELDLFRSEGGEMKIRRI